MVYIQFFHRAVNSDNLIEACGDRSVIILDGRNSPEVWHDIARMDGKKRGYIAYTLNKGESFTRSNPFTKVIRLD